MTGVISTIAVEELEKLRHSHIHRKILRAGHNLTQEEPVAFAAAVMELIRI
jgi:pimeloyl-ACP methyl ester carboxylesterase